MSENSDASQQQNGQQSNDAGENGGNSGYTPPATQADLDRIIADRLSRERSKYGDYDELKAKADKLTQIEDANKTEAQMQADKLAQMQAELDGYKTREQIAEWAKEVADAEGVPADLLRGSTREELEAHAKQLKPLVTAAPKAQPVPGIGQVPDVRNVPLKDQIAAAEKAGDRSLVASLKAMQLTNASAASS